MCLLRGMCLCVNAQPNGSQCVAGSVVCIPHSALRINDKSLCNAGLLADAEPLMTSIMPALLYFRTTLYMHNILHTCPKREKLCT